MAADSITNALLVSIVIGLFYMLGSVVVAPFIGTTGGQLMLNFTDSPSKIVNMILILTSLLAGWLVSGRLQTHQRETTNEQLTHNSQPSVTSTFVLGLLSPGEKAVITAAQQAGEITQDSLRFRLEWSKAKVSAVVAGLERRSVVQRERQGKTYLISLTKTYKDSTTQNTTQYGSERSDQQKSNT